MRYHTLGPIFEASLSTLQQALAQKIAGVGIVSSTGFSENLLYRLIFGIFCAVEHEQIELNMNIRPRGCGIYHLQPTYGRHKLTVQSASLPLRTGRK